MSIISMTDLELRDKRVLIREDLNVPMRKGVITSDKRIKAILPTIKYAIAAGAKVMVLSHLGRPEEGKYDEQYSLAPIAKYLSKRLGREVRLERNWLNGIAVNSGEVVLCENVRFNKGEEENDPALAKKMAALCDIYVMDAFATAHRAQASTCGVAREAPIACAGPLLMAELDALRQSLDNPKHPFIAIVGGAKVSSKLLVLEHLLPKIDQLIVGGGIANTFIAAAGFRVGKSLYEPKLIAIAKQLINEAKTRGADIPLPNDVVVTKNLTQQTSAVVKNIQEVADDEMIVDIGPQTRARFSELIANAKTIVWNGPVGVFEVDRFGEGTKEIADAIAASCAFSIAGGGDTIAAIDKYNVGGQISYISTGGGAFLEYIEGKKLPAVTVLEERGQ